MLAIGGFVKAGAVEAARAFKWRARAHSREPDLVQRWEAEFAAAAGSVSSLRASPCSHCNSCVVAALCVEQSRSGRGLGVRTPSYPRGFGRRWALPLMAQKGHGFCATDFVLTIVPMVQGTAPFFIYLFPQQQCPPLLRPVAQELALG